MTWRPRICVAGAGAIGGTIATRLGASGQNVCVVSRGSRLEQIRREGLSLQTATGELLHVEVDAGSAADFGVQDIIFIAVKAYALPDLLPELLPLVGRTTRVIPLINGIPWWFPLGTGKPQPAIETVDPEGRLLSLLRAETIIGCAVFMTAALQPAGHVRSDGHGSLAIGDIDGIERDSTSAIAEVIERAGITTTVTRDIRATVWTKVALNFATNPLSVVTSATLSQQFNDPLLLTLVTQMLEEIRRLAAAEGSTLTMTAQELTELGRAAGPFRTSMWHSLERGHTLELDAIAYGCLELARKHGLDIPVGRVVADLAAFIAKTRERQPAAATPPRTIY